MKKWFLVLPLLALLLLVGFSDQHIPSTDEYFLESEGTQRRMTLRCPGEWTETQLLNFVEGIEEEAGNIVEPGSFHAALTSITPTSRKEEYSKLYEVDDSILITFRRKGTGQTGEMRFTCPVNTTEENLQNLLAEIGIEVEEGSVEVSLSPLTGNGEKQRYEKPFQKGDPLLLTWAVQK